MSVLTELRAGEGKGFESLSSKTGLNQMYFSVQDKMPVLAVEELMESFLDLVLSC